MPLRTAEFDYPLPPELIAQEPLERRDQSRLLCLRRSDGGMTHRVFRDLPDLLRPDDLLVVNDSRVIPAKFAVRRASGGRIEGLFLRETSRAAWEVMLKGANRCRPGQRLAFPQAPQVGLHLLENLGEGRWHVRVDPPRPAVEILEEVGEAPLPPYIHRDTPEHRGADRTRYQTVYADRPGAVAAPTAGLHFTPEVLEALAARGIRTARVTLHVGLGTFAPVKDEYVTGHRIHSEWYELPEETADAIQDARRQGRRVVAVGTTCVRVLETAGREGPGARSGWTDIFLYPPAEFTVTGAMITNFHLPRSTLVMLVSAFCSPGASDGMDLLRRAYAEAVTERYRFYSYGDAMLIE